MTQYGRIITGTQVRFAVEQTVREWSPSYLGEVCAQSSFPRDSLPSFRSYEKSAQGFNHWPENQLPACVIVSAGTAAGSVERHGTKHGAEWLVGVGILCSGLDQDSAMRNMELYVAAVRTLLVQHGGLGGFATQTRWIDEDYDSVAHDDSRTLAGGVVNIGVRVDAVLDSAGGLVVPPIDPIADPGEAPPVDTTGTTTIPAPPVSAHANPSTQEIDI